MSIKTCITQEETADEKRSDETKAVTLKKYILRILIGPSVISIDELALPSIKEVRIILECYVWEKKWFI